MKAILAVNNLGFIGLNGGLPWHSKADFQHFKKLTKDSRLLVGYNTFQTLPPLKGREVVLCGRDMIDADVMDWGIDWCIGGKKTYERFASYFTELHISHIDDNTIGDTLFPDLRNLNSKCLIYNYYFKDNKILLLEELNLE
jgi:dihydrofolate reductase